MSEQKIHEFRERAQTSVTTPDPGRLIRRGRALRRRRQFAPIAALAALAVLGVGLVTFEARDARTDELPADRPGVTETLDPRSSHTFDSIGDDGQPDAIVELVGGLWVPWSGGAYATDSWGAVSFGFQGYEDTPVDPCHPKRHATSRQAAVSQLSQVPGTVTRDPRPATKLGLTGTYLQLSIPAAADCPNGGGQGTLMASWYAPNGFSTADTVTVDVWLLEDRDRLLLLTRGVRGDPPAERLEALDMTLDTLQYLPIS
jgi:hypothetical protein